MTNLDQDKENKRLENKRRILNAKNSENIRDAFEGPEVSRLVYVFDQLAEMGVKRQGA
jgi:hypothetical protein